MNSSFRILAVGTFLTLGISAACWADQVQGVVDSVDRATASIIIKDPVSGGSKIVRVHPKIVSDIQVGSVVKATLQGNSDQAEIVEVIVSK